MTQGNFINRLNYSGSLNALVNDLCIAYDIGSVTNFSIIETGYEDCNILIETQDEKYVAKIFSKTRDKETIARYVLIMEKVIATGVNHPKLIRNIEGNFIYTDNKSGSVSLVLMKFIEGKSFFELSRIPDTAEKRLIIEQATKISKIDFKPSFLFDPWAIPNIVAIFEKVKHFLPIEDRKLIEKVILKYEKIPIDDLPHCFVHGDFTKANVMKCHNGEIYILDFSVANWYPRIQEIAVIIANLLYNEKDSLDLKARIRSFLPDYEKINPLTEKERKYIHSYALAGVAMEFLGANQEKYINGNNSDETEFWLKLGRNGLSREFHN